MSTQPSPEPLPEGLTAPLEKLVYLYVRERGEASIYDLRDALRVPQLKLYPTITRLARDGLVEQQGDDVSLPDPSALS